jgi:hypothetical protein
VVPVADHDGQSVGLKEFQRVQDQEQEVLVDLVESQELFDFLELDRGGGREEFLSGPESAQVPLHISRDKTHEVNDFLHDNVLHVDVSLSGLLLHRLMCLPVQIQN